MIFCKKEPLPQYYLPLLPWPLLLLLLQDGNVLLHLLALFFEEGVSKRPLDSLCAVLKWNTKQHSQPRGMGSGEMRFLETLPNKVAPSPLPMLH